MKKGITSDLIKSNFKEFDLEKGGKKTGYYANTHENKKLGRVGQKYKKETPVFSHDPNIDVLANRILEEGFKITTEWNDGTLNSIQERFNKQHDRRLGSQLTEAYDELITHKKNEKQTYFDTYASAITYAHNDISKKYKIDENDWFNLMGTGGKPAPGTTKSGIITLYDKETGKEQKKALAIQVYNRDTNKGTFELNYYVS